MKVHKILLAALALAALAAPAVRAASLDSQLGKISEQFARDAAAKLPELNPVTAAVFPFQAEESLARRKVDVAVGELLTQKLLRESKFRLVERAQLDAALREQKLGLSGALESETAARVGKLAGARLAALGSVSRMGRNYQISAKLVDTETSDVISVSIVEVAASVFDEEASRYLVLVPETQTVSVYLVAGGQQIETKKLGTRSVSGVTLVPANVETKGFDPDSGLYAGFGLKYFPFARWALDFAYIPFFKIGQPEKSVLANVAGEAGLAAKAEGKMLRLLAYRKFTPVSRLNVYAGGGFLRYELDPPTESEDYTQNVNLTTGGTVRMAPGFGEGRFLLPLASLGLEFRPQARFGLSALVTMPLSSKTYNWDACGNNDCTQKAVVWEVSVPKYMAELNLAWYF